MESEAKRHIIEYEYMVHDTPKHTVADETWELVDVLPKQRGYVPVYMLVFRREARTLKATDNDE